MAVAEMIINQKFIAHMFDILDEDRTGLLTPHQLLTLLHALGVRLTLPDVLHLIQTKQVIDVNPYDTMTSFRFDYAQQKGYDNLVDLGRVLEIIDSQSNKPSLEYKELFQLFDQNTGYITVQSLEHVISQLYENQNNHLEKNNPPSHQLDLSMTEKDLLAMIHEFDRDGDGKLDYEDFVRMMDS
jgi:Ca2+-binding EF-hand superfamily protein